MPSVAYRVLAPHFVAGLVATDGKVSETAPIIRYMINWSVWRVQSYCDRKGWELEE